MTHRFAPAAIACCWAWINFHLEPWESDRGAFYGACFAALAVGLAPENYAASPDISRGMDALRSYVQNHVERENLLNSAMALWASSLLPDLLKPEQKTAIRIRLLEAQESDGGWSMSKLGTWKRRDDSPPDTSSDGYTTGLAVLALKASKDQAATRSIKRGESWLMTHQDNSGMWYAASVNKRREKDTLTGQFMSDAATAMAVLALTTR